MASSYGMMVGFLAPELLNGVPYLAPQEVPAAPAVQLGSKMVMAFLAPPLFNGLPYLAAPIVFVMPSTVAGGLRASRSSVSRAAPAPKSAPPRAATPYHGRSREQDEIEQARIAELADEESIITFLMEFALV